ncbi:hypothetical protein F2Q69_00011813 [Brassica cretica]|uniref:Uncharacterized protein n=1 Tax=Brassica cretica TaxID=69181 RepID=A0A8S9QQI9_BRACR|nr:hypothetical protein F2Q69_00011813 [Brassica cretica]
MEEQCTTSDLADLERGGRLHDVQVIETTPWNKTERGREQIFSPAGERPGGGVG